MKKIRCEPLENPMYEAFCNEFLIDGIRGKAYRRAQGDDIVFSSKTNITALARQVLAHEDVQERLRYLKREKAKKYKINKKYVIDHWRNIIEDESTFPHTKLQALAKVAEYLEMTNQKIDVNHKGKVDQNINVVIDWKKAKE